MIYAFMKSHNKQFAIKKMAEVFKVSRAGYYKSVDRQEPKRQLANKELLIKIRSIHAESRMTYGSPRIHFALKQLGEMCSRRKVPTLCGSIRFRQNQEKNGGCRTSHVGI
jgi:putative transposase